MAKNNVNTTDKFLKMLERTLMHNIYTEEFNMFAHNELLVLTTLPTFKHKLNTHLLTIFTNIYRYNMEKTMKNFKNIITHYIQLCKMQKIIKFLISLKSLKNNVICSNGIIYYKQLKICFYEFTKAFKNFQHNLILDKNLKFDM